MWLKATLRFWKAVKKSREQSRDKVMERRPESCIPTREAENGARTLTTSWPASPSAADQILPRRRLRLGGPTCPCLLKETVDKSPQMVS